MSTQQPGPSELARVIARIARRRNLRIVVRPANAIQVGDVVRQAGAPPEQRYVVVEIQAPLKGESIRRILINEKGGKDLPFGVGEDRLTKVAND